MSVVNKHEYTREHQRTLITDQDIRHARANTRYKAVLVYHKIVVLLVAYDQRNRYITILR